jgi:nuclear protein localization family protein 4
VERASVSDHQLKHGDIIFVQFVEENGFVHNEEPEVVNNVEPNSQSISKQNQDHVRRLFRACDDVSRSEDEVDVKLWSMSGQISRPRDEKLCRHGPNAKCLHCTPLEPYDEEYLKEHKIKHMSFHSYLRKITRGADR